MSKTFFEVAEFAQRQRNVREVMRSKNLDVLIVLSPVNINYLIGAAAKAYQVFQCLFFTLEEKPLTLMLRLGDVAEMVDHSLSEDVQGWGGRRYEDPIEVFKRIMTQKGLLKARVGLELPAYYLSVHNYQKLQQVLSEATVTDETMLIERLKWVKSAAEIAYIREAARIADIGIDAIRAVLRAGVSEREVAAEAHHAMMAAGGDSPASPMNFVSGDRTCYAHGLPSDRILAPGDFMHIEFGGQYRRYCSTIARHFNLGEPSRRAKQVHQATHDACQAAMSIMKPGARAEDVHRAAVAVLRDAGMEEFNLHTTGYGIAPGFPPSWGEAINMFDQSTDVLEAGMVLSVEPPVFIHGERIGGRLIDCVLIHDRGAEVLSAKSPDLIVM